MENIVNTIEVVNPKGEQFYNLDSLTPITLTSSTFTTDVATGNTNSHFTWDSSNNRWECQFSNNGSQAGFIVHYSCSQKCAVKFEGSMAQTFDNQYRLGFHTSYGSYQAITFGLGAGAIGSQLDGTGARWLIQDNGTFYFTDDNGRIIYSTSATSCDYFIASDVKSDTGGATTLLYITEIREG